MGVCLRVFVLFGLIATPTFATARTVDLSLCQKKPSITLEVASVLGEYADRLARAGKEPQSSQIRQYAGRLSGANEGASSYIGFNPQQVLQSYATLLRRAGQAGRAGQVRALGQRMFDANLACYYLQRQQMR